MLIEDLGSSNGTFVSGQPIKEPTRLWPNQKIQIGAATIELRRIKAMPAADVSLAPQTATVQKLLPEEFLREKKYEIGRVVAQGGMGAILDAKEAIIERQVAMKVMLDGSNPDELTRFVAEAKITGQLEHPSIVPVYELSVDENGQVFYTMKMVRGITLRKVLELLAEGNAETAKKYSLAVLLTGFQKVCDALAFAHAKGVIHRDLKPDNIMLDDFGVVLVMDWGLAKVLGQKPATGKDVGRSLVRTLPPESSTATLAGTVMGTPQYMSPEQARGEVEDLDVRSDIYALGAILYHILALRPPVTGEDAWAIVSKVSQGEVELLTAPKNRTIPDSIAAVVRKAMAFDRDQRYRAVEELQRDIEAYQNGRATKAENASLGKQLVLLVKRHKALFSIVAAAWVIITALAGWFVINVARERNIATSERNIATRERNRAETTLADLRATAPTFFNQAKMLTEQQKFDEALEKIDIALKLNPTASFHAERANILQSSERFADAAAEYETAVKLNSTEPHAAENAELSRTLAAALQSDGALSPQLRTNWRDALTQQGRMAEAIFAGRGLSADAAKMLPAWQAKIDAWLGKDVPRVTLDRAGGCNLNLEKRSLTDISPLRGMPLHTLNLGGNPHLKDLGPLADCTLDTLMLDRDPSLSDLSPLKGKKLTKVQFNECTNLSDLGPLAGMPLTNVELANTAVSDLTPLTGTTLKALDLSNTQVRDLQPLRGQPLETLHLNNVATKLDLDPVGDAPLTYLEIGNPVDLAVLRRRMLRVFRAGGVAVVHPEVLGEMRDLEVLVVPSNLTDPGILRNLPHLRTVDFAFASGRPGTPKADFFRQYDGPEVQGVRAALSVAGLNNLPLKNVNVDPTGRLRVDLATTLITNLTPLRGLSIKELNLNDTSVSDLEPLRGMPLDTLEISRTRVSSLEPLRGTPLVRIQLANSGVSDVSILAEFPDLAEIYLSNLSKNVERLRSLKNLHYISTSWNPNAHRPTQTADEFWKEYDAKHPAARK